MRNPGDVESILDAALREYSRQEPRVGIEQRILRRIETAPPTRRSWWWLGWVFAMIVLTVLVLRMGRTKVEPLPPPISAEGRKPRAIPPPPSPAPAVAVKAKARHRQLPKLGKFPGPEALTEEERALLRFVQSQPDEARKALSTSAQLEEIKIEPLKIEPLQ
jgi:hypothetical protein